MPVRHSYCRRWTQYTRNDNVQDVGLYNINTKGDMLNDIQIRDVFLAYKLVVTE